MKLAINFLPHELTPRVENILKNEFKVDKIVSVADFSTEIAKAFYSPMHTLTDYEDFVENLYYYLYELWQDRDIEFYLLFSHNGILGYLLGEKLCRNFSRSFINDIHILYEVVDFKNEYYDIIEVS